MTTEETIRTELFERCDPQRDETKLYLSVVAKLIAAYNMSMPSICTVNECCWSAVVVENDVECTYTLQFKRMWYEYIQWRIETVYPSNAEGNTVFDGRIALEGLDVDTFVFPELIQYVGGILGEKRSS